MSRKLMGCVTVLHCDRFLSLSFFQVALTTGVTGKQVSRAGYFTDSFHHSQSTNDGVFNLSCWTKMDQLRLLGNCPPTPPLTQHFALGEKWVLMLTWGRGRWAVSQKPKYWSEKNIPTCDQSNETSVCSVAIRSYGMLLFLFVDVKIWN